MKTDAAKRISEQLAAGTIHVWVVPLDAQVADIERTCACLSPGEHARAGRLIDESARRRFIIGRAALRRILGHCAGRDAGGLGFQRGDLGKPRLEGGHGPEFSLSHSRDMAVIALAARPVGIDVEHMRRLRHLERTARRILHSETVDALMALEGHARTAAFLDAWTLREAHVKAVGGGLYQTPDVLRFDASLPADGVLRECRDRDKRATWSVARFAPAAGARAAVVVHGTAGALHIHNAGETLRLITGEAS